MAAPRLRAAKFDEQMTLVEHLDELRNRIIASAAVLVVACGLCFWQNELLLEIANEPLPGDRVPITFGVTEPFMTTLKISIYAGILIALPVLLYQAYAFMLPALRPTEKRVVLPFLLLVPVLFIAGVVFSYFVVVPAATEFLLNFNQDQFNIQVRASEYYSFFILTLIALGFVFQVPMGIVAVTRLGIVTPQQLSHNRRYAYLILAVVAMLLPGTDPVTMLIELAAPAGAVRALADPGPSDRHAGRPGCVRRRSPSRPRARRARLRNVLFDLSGKRKRVVQVSYALLAAVFLVGFIGFGIGSGNSTGGILDAVGLGGDGGGGSLSDQYDEQIDNANQQLATDPKDTAALLKLSKYEFYKAKQGDHHGSQTTVRPTVSEDADTELGKSVDAWERYLKVNKGKPNAGDGRSDRAGVLLPERLRGSRSGAADRGRGPAQLGLLWAARRLPVRVAGHLGRRPGGEEGGGEGAKLARARPRSSNSTSSASWP